MKKLVLISSYCDSEEKKTILKENLIKYKELKLDTLLISPIKLETQITDLCDYYFFTKENPILCWPERAYSVWLNINLDDHNSIKLHRLHCDYGWAALYQTKTLLQIGLNLDYDLYIHTIYDLEIDEYVSDKLINEDQNMIFTRRDPHHFDTLWESTLHLIIFNKEIAQKIERSVSKELYVNSMDFAEGHVLKWKKEYGLVTSEKPVKDKIFYWKGFDHFDYSLCDKYKVFFGKDEENPKFEMIIYNTDKQNYFEINVNNQKFIYSGDDKYLIQTDIHINDVESLEISCNQEKNDYIENYREISYNIIEKNLKNG